MRTEGEKSDGKSGKEYFVSYTTVAVICVSCFTILVIVGLLTGLLPKEQIKCDLETTTAFIPDSEPWKNPRLPKSLRPIHYDLEIKADLNNFTFDGKVNIKIVCDQTTDIILLNTKLLNIDHSSAHLSSVDGRVPNILNINTYPEQQYMMVLLDSRLEMNAEYFFSIEFSGPLTDDLNGFYRSSYTTKSGEKRWLAVTFFSPTNARRAFPCFDDPGLKARFTISIVHRPEYTALSNMPVASSESVMNGWQLTKFQTSLPVSTYLVGYCVCDFVYKEATTKNNIRMRVWSRNDVIGSVDYALDVGVRILEYFQSYLGIDFPLPKIDMLAIPDFLAGAMENWGMITYRETRLLVDSSVTSAGDKQGVCTVIAHELGHQWFGNLVTHAWWDYILLKEGFASFMEYLGSNHVEPTWAMDEQFLFLDLHPVFDSDALASSRPVLAHVETVDEISQQFDIIAYNKGASIFRMVRDFLGDDLFVRGLQLYLQRYKYSNAENDDLWDCFNEVVEDEVLGIDVKTVMHTWTLQMGLPSVNLTRNYGADTGSFSAKQHHFLINPDANFTTKYDDLGYVWWVPLSILYQKTINQPPIRFWMENDDVMHDLPDVDDAHWIIVNIKQAGYYRVNYDQQNWNLISIQLIYDHNVIPVANRASLLSDANKLAQAGELNQVTALDLTRYLDKELEYVPWSVAMNTLGYIEKMLKISPAYGSFQKYMLRQISPLYEHVGWTNTGEHLTRMTRSTALSGACHYGNNDCINMAIEMFHIWMNTPSDNRIASDLRSVIYCTAVKSGDQNEWYFVLDQYQKSQVAGEQDNLRYALSCSQEPWALSTYLNFTMGSEVIRPQDWVSAVNEVAKNPVGTPLAWNFFRENWDYFRQMYGDSLFQFTSLIKGVTSNFNTEFHLHEVLSFMEQHPDQGTGRTAFLQSVEQIEANIRWMSNNYDQVKDWLHKETNEKLK
ncbi:aminopeptidase N-like isoform X2 [Anneissia japonica]|uniref:aminopeptidase N-like isoform X2 n=1 Tax=Anneissia japonica TaxID=1529436 RepID=UPI0014256525|nr:aminopeptidase N-like isoform X2 [Anneissia japonica]